MLAIERYMYARKRIYHGCSVRIENLSLGITVWHHKAQPGDAKQWPSDGFFYPHLTLMKDSYILPFSPVGGKVSAHGRNFYLP